MTLNLLIGHSLWYKGAPHDGQGNRLTARTWPRLGRAKCTCGQLSPLLPSNYQRKAWHRDIHKSEIRARLAKGEAA